MQFFSPADNDCETCMDPVERAKNIVSTTELPLATELAGSPLAAQPAVLTPPCADDGEAPPSILIVDRLKLSRDLLKAILRSSHYRILEATRPSEALAILEQDKVDLVILDLMMPEMSGPELCRQLKASRKTALIPLLILTSIQGIENEITGLAAGADEFLLKPLHPAVVRTRIQTMLRNKRAIDSLEEAETILFALAQSVEQRDKYTAGHCQRLAMYSVALGDMLGLSQAQLRALQCGGYLHDIGKIGVPDSVLYHNGPLSEEQWKLMRRHTTVGESICRPMKSLRLALPIIRNHHERWDGSGYPDGLKGEQIPILARVLQLADIYDALTTARPYKPALSGEEAIEILEDETRRGWRDPELMLVFRELSRNKFQEALAGELLVHNPHSITRSLENMRLNLLK